MVGAVACLHFIVIMTYSLGKCLLERSCLEVVGNHDVFGHTPYPVAEALGIDVALVLTTLGSCPADRRHFVFDCKCQVRDRIGIVIAQIAANDVVGAVTLSVTESNGDVAVTLLGFERHSNCLSG